MPVAEKSYKIADSLLQKQILQDSCRYKKAKISDEIY